MSAIWKWAVSSTGRSAKGVGAISTGKTRLPSCEATRNSVTHQREATHSGETRTITAEQRSPAFFSSSCQR